MALNQETKKKVLIDEWKQAVKPQVKVPEKTNTPPLPKINPVKLEPELPTVFQKKITLRSSGISLRTALEKIGLVTGYNVIFDPEADPNRIVSIDTTDVPVWRALNTILFPLSYGFKIKDKDLIILSQETRTFKITLPPNTQAFSDRISNESWTKANDSGLGTGGNSLSNGNSNMNIKVGARIFLESKEEEISFWKDIETGLSKMISACGKYSFNKPAGIVVVTDNPNVLDKITSYIDLVNRETNKQIQVEVKILEVTLTKETAYGIDWNAIYKKLGDIQQINLTSAFSPENLAAANLFTLAGIGPKDNSGTLSALITALETQGRVEVVSEPKIMLLNNQSAMVQVGTVTSYVSNTTTTTTQAGLAATSAATDQVQEGVSLRLMASILDDEILIQMTPVVTTLEQIRSINMGQGTIIEAPKTSTKSMHTLVKVKDGSTIAVGGLITTKNNKEEKGIPIVRSIPLIGGLFGYKNKTNARTELVIFITPKILHR